MTHLSQALEFRRVFGQSNLASVNCLPSENRFFAFQGISKLGMALSLLSMQLGLIEEEGNEFKEAILAWVEAPSKEAKAHVLKELADLVYTCYQMAAFLSADLDEALDRVHASNMSKPDENGNAIYNEFGKIMKGPNYKEPDLSDLV